MTSQKLRTSSLQKGPFGEEKHKSQSERKYFVNAFSRIHKEFSVRKQPNFKNEQKIRTDNPQTKTNEWQVSA